MMLIHATSTRFVEPNLNHPTPCRIHFDERPPKAFETYKGRRTAMVRRFNGGKIGAATRKG
jgi:hypothetical protein